MQIPELIVLLLLTSVFLPTFHIVMLVIQFWLSNLF